MADEKKSSGKSKALTQLEKDVYETFGMLPNEDRLTVLPRYKRGEGFIAPEFMYDLAKAVQSPRTAMYSELSPEEAINMGLNVMGGSSVASAPRGALRMGIAKPTLEPERRAVLMEAERALPLNLPRAPAKSKQEIAAHAERVGRQMLGEHVRSGQPKKTQNLAGRSLRESQRLQNLQYELEPLKELPPIETVQPRIGDINVAVPGDTSISDLVLKSIEGEPIGSVQQGGSFYGLGKLDRDDPLFWASNEGPAQQMQDKITDVAALFEPERVLAQHLAMGRVANNFAQHFADASLRAIDYSKLSAKDMNTFDNVIAGGYTKKNKKTGEVKHITFPNWPGIADPEGALAAMKADPEMRKWFLSRMKTPELTKATNMPNGLDIEWAITHPELRNMEVNLTGHSVGEMVPGAKLADDPDHETYLKGIRGTFLGQQENLTPFAISYPDATQHIASTQRPQDFTGTIQKVFPHQRVDQQYLDEYYEYMRQLQKMLTGRKKGGAVEEVEGGLAPYGLRHSGEGVKGKGYFGAMAGREGTVTELSAEDESGEFPLVVPTLTAEELDRLLAGGEPTPEMIDKASSWAATRRKRGQSPFASPTEVRMPRPKAEGGSVYSPRPGLVFVGQEHGAPADVPQEIRDLANQVGAFYEGSGGDKLPDIRYRGSWDDAASKSVKGYPPEYLYTIFTNTDVNRQKDALVGEGTIFNNLLKNQQQVGYFKDRRFNRKDLSNFLQSMGPEFLRDSQNPATESNVEDFLKRGEQLMWESGDTPARQLADRANESRQRWLLNQPKGVFFMGSDHLQKLKELHGAGKKTPVRKADGGAITDLPDEVNPSNWREHLQNNVRADAQALLGVKDGGAIDLNDLIEQALKKKDGGAIDLNDLIEWTLAKKEHRKMKEGGAVKMADGGQTFPLQRPEEVTDLKPRPRTKRDELLEMLSKGVGSVHEFMAKPFGYENPPGEMVSSLIGLPGTAKTLERMAYGDPLTSGAGMTTNLLPETTEAAFLGLGAAPTALKMTKNLPVGMSIKPTTTDLLDLELASKMKASPTAVVPEAKAGKIKAPANPVGFYNPAEKAALNLQRKKGPGSAFISDLKKQPGVTDERIAELGLTDLASNPNVTREEVIATVEQNRIPLRESVRRPYDEAAEYSDTISGIEDSLIYYRGGVKDVQAELERVRKMAPNSPLVKQYEDKLAVMRDKVDELEAKLDSTKPAKFGPDVDESYSLPGGEDYREIRVRLPSNRPSIKNMSRDEYNAAIEKADREGISDFMHQSHHDNEPNVLFHLRVANHVDEEGKRGLLIDELQSDWHQAGREKGYAINKELPKNFKVIQDVNSEGKPWGVVDENNEWVTSGFHKSKEAAEAEALTRLNKNAVPNAPFKDNWYQLGLKRAIKEAVDTGMDRVYLTTGARQADRYDLSRQLSRVSYQDGVLHGYDKSDALVVNKAMTPDELPNYVGKDLGKKMVENAQKDAEIRNKISVARYEGRPESEINALRSQLDGVKTDYAGVDLKVGGEGMKQYYDKNYKNYLEKYAKQHGGKLGMTHLKTREEWPFPITIKEENGQFRLFGRDPRTDSFNPNLAGRSFDSYDDALKARDTLYEGFAEPVYYIDLTDAMRESAKKGQSYADGGGVFNTDPDITDAGRIIPEHTI